MFDFYTWYVPSVGEHGDQQEFLNMYVFLGWHGHVIRINKAIESYTILVLFIASLQEKVLQYHIRQFPFPYGKIFNRKHSPYE